MIEIASVESNKEMHHSLPIYISNNLLLISIPAKGFAGSIAVFFRTVEKEETQRKMHRRKTTRQSLKWQWKLKSMVSFPSSATIFFKGGEHSRYHPEVPRKTWLTGPHPLAAAVVVVAAAAAAGAAWPWIALGWRNSQTWTQTRKKCRKHVISRIYYYFSFFSLTIQVGWTLSWLSSTLQCRRLNVAAAAAACASAPATPSRSAPAPPGAPGTPRRRDGASWFFKKSFFQTFFFQIVCSITNSLQNKCMNKIQYK